MVSKLVTILGLFLLCASISIGATVQAAVAPVTFEVRTNQMESTPNSVFETIQDRCDSGTKVISVTCDVEGAPNPSKIVLQSFSFSGSLAFCTFGSAATATSTIPTGTVLKIKYVCVKETLVIN